MADTPEKPASPDPAPDPSKSNPWIYTDIPGGGYYTPKPVVPESFPAEPAPTTTPADQLPPATPAAGSLPREPQAQPVYGARVTPSAPASPAPATARSGLPAAKPKKEGEDETSLAGVIDTIEAIIIALIVALTFRAFIVEAFVIPTGSMAPTLLGAHFKVICPKCGKEYDLEANISQQFVKDPPKHFAGIPGGQGNPAAELASNRLVPLALGNSTMCPNCHYVIADKELPQALKPVEMFDGRVGSMSSVNFAWANNGDRILVLKYLYSVMEPHRWDVIVFKEPKAAQTNYIKRLIGLPNEAIQIINGDIYVQANLIPGQVPENAKMIIQRKPEEIQPNLWQDVYDNDCYPTDEGSPRAPWRRWLGTTWICPWQQDAVHAKDWDKGPVMTYKGSGPSTLSFQLQPPGAPESYPPYGLNTLGYNNDLEADEIPPDFAPRSIVGDLKLEAIWAPSPNDAQDATRAITLTLGRPNNCYRVIWNAQGMQMERLHPVSKGDTLNGWVKVDATASAGLPTPERGRSYSLALTNVDHVASFYVDGRKVLTHVENWNAQQAIDDLKANPVDWSNSQARRPDNWDEVKGELNTVIKVDVGGACQLSHLKVARDLYYTQVTETYRNQVKQLLNFEPSGLMGNPIVLGKDEYFALGDNSRRSSDGRLWDDVHGPLNDLGVRPGIVPARYLLGKAFFVYWPAGYTPVDPRSDVPLLKDLPLVPNAGSMRVIR